MLDPNPFPDFEGVTGEALGLKPSGDCFCDREDAPAYGAASRVLQESIANRTSIGILSLSAQWIAPKIAQPEEPNSIA
jgi:hypothetical protein